MNGGVDGQGRAYWGSMDHEQVMDEIETRHGYPR
jgi:hypothetical protein